MLMSIVWWIVVGLIAGFLASVVMRGGGYGVVGDVIVGLVGALIGGFLDLINGLLNRIAVICHSIAVDRKILRCQVNRLSIIKTLGIVRR